MGRFPREGYLIQVGREEELSFGSRTDSPEGQFIYSTYMKAYMILRGKCHTKRSEIHSVKVYLKSVLLSKTLCLSHITLNVFVPRIHKYILVFFIFVTCFPDRTVKILEGN